VSRRLAAIGLFCRRHEHLSAAALIAVLVLVLLWPALVGGELLAPLSTLYNWFPWYAYRPPDVSAFDNSTLSDVPLAFYPWTAFARRAFQDGIFPTWNPYVLSGTPFFANAQAGLLSPFNAPLWILPLRLAFAVTAAMKLWLAGFGTYLLIRELRLSFWAAMVAGVSFSLCAFNVVWLTHGVHVAVAALLPWTILAIERIIRSGHHADAIALAVVMAIALAAGHPGTQVHLFGAGVVYALVRSLLYPDLPARKRLHRLSLVGGGMALSALLTALVILPIALAASDTAGEVARQGGGGTLPLSSARTVLFPDWWGRPSEIATEGPHNYNERTFYAGAVALLLAVVALITQGACRRKLPFVLFAVLGLAVPLNAPVVHWAVVQLPLFSSIYNSRMLLLFDLGVAVLAAFGLQALMDRPRERRRAYVVVVMALGAGAIAVASLQPSLSDLTGTFRHFAAGTPYEDPRIIALTSVGWWLLFATGIGVALLALKVMRRRWPVTIGMLVLAAADMLHFAHGYQPIGPPSKVIPPTTPAVAFLKRHAGDDRVVGLGFTLANNWNMVEGLRDVRGHDPPQPSLRYFRLWRLASPFQPTQATLTLPDTLDASGVRVMSVLGVRWIVTAPSGARPMGPGLSPAYRGKDAVVYQNARAAPRAIVARYVRSVAGEEAALAALVDPKFDPRTMAVVEDESRARTPTVSGRRRGSVRVVEEDNARVRLRASLTGAGLVVLNESWAKGWSVRIDGRPATALRVNSVLRGVRVPPGEHTIEWEYRVPGLRLGLAITALGALAMLSWVAVVARRRNRSLTKE
jgi:hypothetical protein